MRGLVGSVLGLGLGLGLGLELGLQMGVGSIQSKLLVYSAPKLGLPYPSPNTAPKACTVLARPHPVTIDALECPQDPQNREPTSRNG